MVQAGVLAGLALGDPAGQGAEAVRPIRDQIEQHVRGLLAELGIEPVA